MAHRLLALGLAFLALTAPTLAADTKPDVKGLYLLTDYPAVSVEPGTTSTVNLKLRNYGLAPERLRLRAPVRERRPPHGRPARRRERGRADEHLLQA